MIVAAVIFLLTILEAHAPIDLAFEAFSAFATVGLSTGITSELSISGKIVITIAMFIGRIGPLTLALAVSVKAKPLLHQLPEERVMIG